MELNGEKIYTDYFDLYIPVKNQVLFEQELINKKIDFYFDKVYKMPDNNLRYYFKKGDFELVDNIVVEKGIIAGTRQIMPDDFQEGDMAMKLYIKVAAVVILLFIVAVFVMSLVR